MAPPRRSDDRSRVMRFQLLDIVPHAPHPVTGEIISVHERLQRVIETAVLAERLGFDSYAVGERHAGQFVSSAPTVLLGAIAQATERILLSTGVTVFSLHIANQYDYLTENYELLRRLLGEEDVAWRGTYRASLDGATTYPRPFA